MSEENKSNLEEFFTLNDIVFDGKTLLEWENELTIQVPSLPATSYQITNALIDVNNKYQSAYNSYNKLFVLTNKVERRFSQERDKKVSEKIQSYIDKGAKTTPTIDKLELIVLGEDDQLKELYDLKEIYSNIRDFFKNNKQKLENVIEIIRSISFSVNGSEKRDGQNREGHGL